MRKTKDGRQKAYSIHDNLSADTIIKAVLGSSPAQERAKSRQETREQNRLLLTWLYSKS